MALLRQEKLYGAHEIQRFNRDADETVAWIAEKDAVLSSDEYGRDLVSVQTLQRKHEGMCNVVLLFSCKTRWKVEHSSYKRRNVEELFPVSEMSLD